jgi:hypothetical protein
VDTKNRSYRLLKKILRLPNAMSKCGGNLIKSEENIILITQIAPDLSPAASIYPYILSPASNRYGLECVFEAVAADNSAGVVMTVGVRHVIRHITSHRHNVIHV